ncbi:MAG: hypothetical protein H7Y00_01215, partial [Fimbriimonadaceae bacterium]|nr:hypothetical protein [Chitinophagales bacterium]
MKKKKLFFAFIIILIILSSLGIADLSFAKSAGVTSGSTGSIGDGQSCAREGCHNGSAIYTENLISINVPEEGYLSSEMYTVSVTIDAPGVSKFGFQASPQDIQGNMLGKMSLMNTGETQFEIDDEYITHTLSGTSGSDTKTWTFNWTPGSSTGDVTFYVAVNASNHDDDADGDNIFLSSVTFSENPENTPLQIGENDPQISFTMNNPVKDI